MCRTSSCSEVFCKKVFLKVSQNSQENTCARVSFLIKLQAWPCNFVKNGTLAQVFSCELCEISKKNFFPIEHRWWLFLCVILSTKMVLLYWKDYSGRNESNTVINFCGETVALAVFISYEIEFRNEIFLNMQSRSIFRYVKRLKVKININKRCFRGSINPHIMPFKWYFMNRSGPASVNLLVWRPLFPWSAKTRRLFL